MMRLITSLIAVALILMTLVGCGNLPTKPAIPSIPGVPGLPVPMPGGSAGACPPGLLPFPLPSSGTPTAFKYHVAECSNLAEFPEVMVCYFETAPNPVGETLLFGTGFTKKADVLNTNLYDALVTKIRKPTRIVSFSFCSGAMITGYPNRALPPPSATLDNFKQRILPAIEAWKPQIKSESGKYKLSGHSMGASNAATLSAVYPDLFSKVALINPMLIKNAVDPMPVQSLMDAFSFKILIANGGHCLACMLINDHFPNVSTWNTHKPSALIKRNMPPMWITACKTDMFNLKPATDEYESKLRSVGNKTTYLAGASGCSHDTFDGLALARFLELN